MDVFKNWIFLFNRRQFQLLHSTTVGYGAFKGQTGALQGEPVYFIFLKIWLFDNCLYFFWSFFSQIIHCVIDCRFVNNDAGN